MSELKPQSLWSGMRMAAVFAVLSKGVGYARQLLVAYYFGVQRGLDVYFMAFNITMLIAFSYTTWFDQVGVAHLVQTREKEGQDRFRALAGSLLSFSAVMGAGMAVATAALFPLLSRGLASGFSAAEQAELRRMSFYFLPWVLAVFPYSAAAGVVKSLRFYSVLLWADLGVSVVSLAGFFLFHDRLAALPLSLAAGQLCALAVFLAVLSGRVSLAGGLRTDDMRALYRKFLHLFGAGNAVLVYQVLDRYFQSYLRPGVISALNYASQTLAPLNELLGFKDFYVVPLSSETERSERLHRLLCGMTLLVVPLAAFLNCFSTEIVGFLYERGRFGAGATEMTGRLFGLMVLIIVPGALSGPLVRVLQIQGRILQSGLGILIGAALSAVSNAVLLFAFNMTDTGTAVTAVLIANVNCLLMAWFVARGGTRLRPAGLAKYALYAGAAAAAGVAAARFAPPAGSYLAALAAQGAAFGLVVAAFYWPLRGRIRGLLHGSVPA